MNSVDGFQLREAWARKAFLEKHDRKITGVLSCFDRMLFRGYLPIMSGAAMAKFLNQEGIKFSNLKTFLIEHAATLKAHAQAMAEKAGRPYIYLAGAGMRREQRALEIAQADGIQEGLVCVFAQVEPRNTFSFRFQQGRPFVNSAKRKCQHIYYYFVDREFGLIHVMVQTWFPMRMHVFVNGHNWLANKLAANGIRFSQCDNVLLWIEDVERAQGFADRLTLVDWPAVLNRYARKINPLMGSLLGLVAESQGRRKLGEEIPTRSISKVRSSGVPTLIGIARRVAGICDVRIANP